MAGSRLRLAAAAAAVMGLAVLAYLPTLRLPMDIDEAMFTYGGRAYVLEGRGLYRAIYDHKPPGVFLLYGFTEAVLGPGLGRVRAVFALVVGLTAAGLLLWLRESSGRGAALLGGAAYAVLLPWVFTPKAYTEIPLALAATGGLYLTYRAIGMRRPRLALWAGALLGLAVAINQLALSAALAATVALLLLDHRSGRQRLAATVALLLGLSLTGAVAYLASHGLGEAGLLMQEVVWGPLRGGHPPPPPAEQLRLARAYLPLAVACSPLLVALLVSWRQGWPRQDPLAGKLALLWLAPGAVAVLTAGRFYPHYAVILLPPLILGGAPGVARALGALGRRLGPARAALLLGGVALALLGAAAYLQQERVAKVWTALSDPPPALEQELGSYLQANTAPTETIFVLGSLPQVYVYAERRAAARYVLPDKLVTPQLQTSALVDLLARPPAFLLITRSLAPEAAAFTDLVRRELLPRYEQIAEPAFPGVAVYRRRE